MGLPKDDVDHGFCGAHRWALPAVIATTAILFAFLAESGREWLRYERDAIAAGEAWRLLSGHLVHLGWSHLGLNLAGLALVWYLVGDALTPRRWAVVAVASVIGIDLGFWWLEPQLEWYVGLSGALHGLLAAGLVAGWNRIGAQPWLLCGALLAKLAYEQVAGPIPGSQTSTGGTVITAAHLYGAIAGGLAGGLYAVRRRLARL